MSNKQYHYLYITENKVNGRLYIGVHSTKLLKDGYLGSGTGLKNAIKMYGRDNFEKTIIEFFDSREEMFKAEEQVVNTFCIKNEVFYNMQVGGSGKYTGDTHPWKGKNHTDEAKLKISKSKKGKSFSKEHIKSLVKSRKKRGISQKQIEHNRRIAGTSNRKQTIHLETGFVFDSLSEACKSLNYSYAAIRTKFYLNSKTNPFLYV